MRWLNEFFGINGKSIIIAFFFICAFPVGILTALLTPLGQSPDEPAHLARAAGLLHGAILPVRKLHIDANTNLPEAMTGVKVDSGLYTASFGGVTQQYNRPVETLSDLNALQSQPADHTLEFAGISNTATYFPTAYIPATIGLFIGLKAGASPYYCILLARIMMDAAFLLIGGYALRIAAYGETVLLTVLLMPMTLFLSGTLNEDGLLIAFACLGCAALTNSGANSPRMRWFGLAVFAVFLGSKPPYIPILGVALLPLFDAGILRRLREVFCACLPVLFWVVIIALFVAVPLGKPPYHPGPLYSGDRSVLIDHAGNFGNLNILLSHPSRFITLPWTTNERWGVQKLREMVGFLGLLQISLPDRYYFLWAFAGASSLLGLIYAQRPTPVSTKNAMMNFVAVCFILIFTYWLIMISFYLNWTNLGEDFIDGLQGRYSLPLLPLLIFAIPTFAARDKISPHIFAIPTILLGLADIAYIPLKLVLNYYVH